jgi:hypothetical protein
VAHIGCTFVDATTDSEIGYKAEIDPKNEIGIIGKIKISRFWIFNSVSNILEGY